MSFGLVVSGHLPQVEKSSQYKIDLLACCDLLSFAFDTGLEWTRTIQIAEGTESLRNDGRFMYYDI